MIAKVHYSAVGEARRLVAELILFESRGAGDLENSMKRLAHRHGIPWRTFWTLRYRAPKDVLTGVMRKLQEAHRHECGRQINRIKHELEIARLSGVPIEDLADQAATLAAELEDCLAHRRNRKA